MDPELWRRVEELYHRSMELDESHRAEFLQAWCEGDEVLRHEVESLLNHQETAENFIESPALEIVGKLVAREHAGISNDRVAAEYKSIGHYRLLKKLGEGGMGQVWLAEQTAPLRRQVALKLIKVGIYDDSVLHRFLSERQSLAMLDHPSIAKVFDAGATPDGQPYFVMEYVEGVPITTYCDQKRLEIRERLELFIKICEGVQHAHHKAIIHRDLKPANIMVAEVDGKPVPRIIDFGLAKAAAPLPIDENLYTQIGAALGTPGYMSPEQADYRVHDVDTRTDVYSLGVVLYVLLTGALPFDPKQWQKLPLHEVLRQLREDDPPRPSVQFAKTASAETESASATAQMRQTEPKHLVSLLRGDLDWITMKALEKDRTGRYGTPSELAADLARYVRNEPVVARPTSTSYRMRKYLRRHRVGVAAAAIVIVLLVAFAVMQAVQLRRITRERDRANRITDFMTSMFKVSDPSEARGNSITAREMLDKASQDIDTGLAKDPELQAQMMQVMGHVYDGLGLYPRAQSLQERSIDIWRRVRGPQNPETVASIGDLAWTLRAEGHIPEAEKLQRDTLAVRFRTLGPKHTDTLKSMSELALTLQAEGHYPEAEKLLRETLETQRRISGPKSLDTAASMMSLGSVLADEGRWNEAEQLQRETFDIRRGLMGPGELGTVDAMFALARTLDIEGHYSQAENLLGPALETRRRIQGPEHPATLLTLSKLGWVVYEEGHYGSAEKLQRQAIEIATRALGPEHPQTMGLTARLAVDLDAEGRYGEAENLQRQVIETYRRSGRKEYPGTLLTMDSLAQTLRHEARYAEAEKLELQAIEIARRTVGPQHPYTLSFASELADDLAGEGRYAEAEKLARESLESERRASGPDDPHVLATMGTLARTLDRKGQSAEAEKLLREVVSIQRRVLEPEQPELASSMFGLACVLVHRGRDDDAFSVLRDAVDHGLSPVKSLSIEKDPDLKPLHGDPRFETLVAHAKERAASAQKAR